jgi:hypothetical protein
MFQRQLAAVVRQRKWIALILALLLMATAVQLAAAAPPAQETQTTQVRFPRVVISLDADGVVQDVGVMISEDTRLRFGASQLAFLSSVIGIDLRQQMFNRPTMDALAGANIQHVEIQTGRPGVGVYGNGQFLMGVKYGDEQTLNEVVDILSAVGIQFRVPVTRIVPAIGADVLIELPTPAGTEPIATRPLGSGVDFPAPEEMAGEPDIVLHANGQYNANGTPMILGESLFEWTRLLGLNLATLRLHPAAMAALQGAGVNSIGVALDSAGASFLVGSEPVATVVIGSAESLEVPTRLAERFQIPFADLIPLASRTQDMDIQLLLALPE